MNQSPHAIGKQNIHLPGFDDGRYFTFTECRMHDGLAPPIGALAIIRSTGFCRHSAGCTALVRNARSAYWTTDTRNFSFFRNRGDDVASLFAAVHTHLLDSITEFVDLFLFHVAPLFLVASVSRPRRRRFCPGSAVLRLPWACYAAVGNHLDCLQLTARRSLIIYQRGSRVRPRLLRSPSKRPRLLPKRRPPSRFSRGLASLTFSARPPTSLPLNCSIAAVASSGVDISTKAKPRERPVMRSSTTLADSTVPACANKVCSSSLVVWNARFPT